MLFVTGKGGTGKTTVAAALALASARSGRRTIVCEFAGQAHIPRLFGAAPATPGEEIGLADHLWATTIESWEVLEEWVARILGSKALTSVLVRSNFFRAFADAAPGGMELGEIVKTWELAQDRRWNRHHRRYDLVIVDGPASGHAIGLLRTPGTFADVARVGPIASQSRRVRTWLADEALTAFVAVALAEELPVAETIDLGGRLEEAIGRRLEAVVVNELLPDRFSDAELAAVEAAAPGSETAAAVHAADARADLQAEQLARLEAAVDLPIHRLPFVFAPAIEREHVEAFADRLGVA
jgi:anion-transporting  ArsA/GET3 family ATPase